MAAIRSSSGTEFDIELKDAQAEGPADLVVRFGDTREDDALGRHAGRPGALDLPARDRVGTCPGQGQSADHGQIVIGLERVTEKRRPPAKGALQGPEPRAHGAGRIDVDGRAGLRRDPCQRHVLGMESAVAIGEGCHCSAPPLSIAGPAASSAGPSGLGDGSSSVVPLVFSPGGSFSGPRLPQPARAEASRIETKERASVRLCHMTSGRSARMPISES